MGKTKEIQKDGATGGEKKPAEAKAAKPAAAPGTAPHGGGHAAPAAPSAKAGVGAKLGCLVLTCKDKDVRASFCAEHFRQFKFGLITKTGLQVSDFERKFEHYQGWLKAQKVA